MYIWREIYYLDATNITFSNTQKDILLAQGTLFIVFVKIPSYPQR